MSSSVLTFEQWQAAAVGHVFSSSCPVDRDAAVRVAHAFVHALERIDLDHPSWKPGRPGLQFRQLLREGRLESARELFLSRSVESWSINGFSRGIAQKIPDYFKVPAVSIHADLPAQLQAIRDTRAIAQCFFFLFAQHEERFASPLLSELAARLCGEAALIVRHHEEMARESWHQRFDRQHLGYDETNHAWGLLAEQASTYGPCYTAPDTSPWRLMWLRLFVLHEEHQSVGVAFGFSLIALYRGNTDNIRALNTHCMRSAYAAWEAQSLRQHVGDSQGSRPSLDGLSGRAELSSLRSETVDPSVPRSRRTHRI